MSTSNTESKAHRPAQTAPSGISRRGFVAGSASSAAVFGLATKFATTSFARPRVNLGTRSDLLFMQCRLTNGYNKNELGALKAGPSTPKQYLDALLDLGPIAPDPKADDFLQPALPFLNSKPCQFWTQFNGETGHYEYIGTCPGEGMLFEPKFIYPSITVMQIATFGRSALTVNQLFDRTVRFLTNHINIWINKVRFLKLEDDREVIRKHAFGRYQDLLGASARSAAMGAYLDNAVSTKTTKNENYGREFLELHSTGVRDPRDPTSMPYYDETEMLAAVDIFTGWTFQVPTQNPSEKQFGLFEFNKNGHVSGPKMIFGETIEHAEDPIREGNALIDLVSNPDRGGPQANGIARFTAIRLAYKLIKYFLTYYPDTNAVDQAADAYMANGGDLREMLRVLLDPANISANNDPANLKVRDPYGLLAALCRATEANVLPTAPQTGFVDALRDMGQAPMEWPAPDGYPDDPAHYSQNLLPRWNVCHRFFDTGSGRILDVELLDDQLASMLGYTVSTLPYGTAPHTQLTDAIEDMLIGEGAMAPEDKNAVQAFLDEASMGIGGCTVPKMQAVREACALAAASPSFNYC